jgi:NhaP-type Na+/H+ and K+/H+ antiporter
MKQMTQMNRNNISVEPKVRNLCISVSSAVKKTVVREPQIMRMKQMTQMNRNDISVEPKVRNS